MNSKRVPGFVLLLSAACAVNSVPPAAAPPQTDRECRQVSPWVALGIGEDAPSCKAEDVELRWDPTPITNPMSPDPNDRRRAVAVMKAREEILFWCWQPVAALVQPACRESIIAERCQEALRKTPKGEGAYELNEYITVRYGRQKALSLTQAKRVRFDTTRRHDGTWTTHYMNGRELRTTYDANSDGKQEIVVRREQHPCGFPDESGQGGGCHDSVDVACDFEGDGVTDDSCSEWSGAPSPDGGCDAYRCAKDPRWSFGPIH